MIREAHIVAVGDEVLWGETINTNAAWMARFLMSFGVRPTFQCVVPDEDAAIGAAVRQSLASADLVVMIGGLGPTADDRTLDAVSRALALPWHVDEALFRQLSQRHTRAAGWESSVRRQSRVIEGAEIWPNPRGQAPGQQIQWQDRHVILLPGPPRELEGIAEQWMGPWLAQQGQRAIRRDTYSVFDLGESAVAAHLFPLLEGQHPRAGIYAQPGRVDIRVETQETAWGQIQRRRVGAWLRHHLPVPVYELGGESREAFFIRWLQAHQMTVAAMESLTGGMIVSQWVSIPGASAAVLGGVVAYQDQIKIAHGVPEAVIREYGVVSPETALAMARAIRAEFHASIGVASTGYAGPDGGSDREPVGSFYVAAVASHGEVVRHRYSPLDRQAVRQMACHTAMSAVWELLGLPTRLTPDARED
ncbi:MAG: nicotinamide-nucleotide amidohydrolase family protein [Firmicutes bacterium]|nr:nicotinamide-nucleotide amidohydrolase family protein [Bacillota bacterium]